MLNGKRRIWQRFLSIVLAVVLVCTTGSTSWIGEVNAETETADSAYAAQIGEEYYLTLQEAVTALEEAAANGETLEGVEILLLKNVAENITSTGVDYTLNMQGYTVSAPEGSANRVYTINGGTVTLKNGTITGGNTASDNGAGLAVLSGAVLTANNLTVTENTKTSGVGGGMYIDASAVTMVDCTVSDNISASDGGGIEMKNGSSLTADNLTVSGNQATNSGTWGGGICVEGSSSQLCNLVLTNSDIIGNSAGSSGGGIYMTYTAFSATDTHIDYNTSGSNGGGIATSGTSSRNPSITFEGACTVSGNTAGTGGGLYVYTNDFYADGLVINGNTATKSSDDAAAGLYLRASTLSTLPGNAVLKNVEISDNVNANAEGTGGLYVNVGTGTQHYASFQMLDCQVLRNQGSTYSGAYFRVHSNDNQSTELVNCDFRDNALGDTLCLFGTLGSGGTGTRYSFSDCRIENNNASADGKVGGINAGTNSNPVEKLVLINTVITGNSGAAAGGILGWPYVGEGSAVYGNIATDGFGANDLKIPYYKTAIQSTAMNNALSVPAAAAMTDGEQSFAEYVWKDYNGNGYTLNGAITKDTLDAVIGTDGTAPSYFCFTAGPDITRYVAEITNSDGETAKFERVTDAVAAAQDGDTIRLIAGEEDNSGTVISENVQIPAGTNITLDMNGRTLMSLTGGAIEVAEGASLILNGTAGSSVQTRYNETYAITNRGTLMIGSSAIGLSGIDNQGGSLTLTEGVQMTALNCQGGDATLSENVQVTTVNCQEGGLTLSENVQITALNNQEGSLVLSDNDQIGTLNNLAGSLSLSENVQIGTIRHQGGNLTLSGNVQADTITHQGDSLEISGNAAAANINLAAGKYVTADGSFNPEEVTFTLAATELKALNSWGETTVTLIAPAAGAVLAEGLVEKVTLTGINALVVIERDVTGSIVARTRELDGVFVDGVKGDDTNSGTHDAPVKTFDRAAAILTEKLNQGVSVGGIYVLNTITVSTDEAWSMGEALNAAGMKLMREPSFTGALASVTGGAVLALSDITIDGMGKEGTAAGSALLRVNSGAELDIRDGAVLTNNYRTTGYGGAIYSDGGTVVMTGGEVSGNSSRFGGGIGLDGGALTISGGKVTGNTAEEDGGGIAVFGDAQMLLTGNGTISENTARLGGGISLGGSTTVTLGDGGAKLTMSGGVIEKNTSKAEGGGIYIQCRDSAKITAGDIIDNTSKFGMFGGGGIYVNGTRNVDGTNYQYGMLYLTNALITGNSAGEWGGGIAGCSTSTVNVYQKNGAYVTGNTAGDGSNQIFVSHTLASLGKPDYFISEYMPDGTPYFWNNYGVPAASDLLWDNHSTIKLDSSASSEEASTASVRITGNSAQIGGGGIGTNGFVQIGEPGETLDISVTKNWNDADNKEGLRPDSVKIWLMRSTDGATYERVSFLKFDNQTGDSRTETLSFKQQPQKDAEGKPYIYTVEEELPAKADGSAYPYTAVISGTAENGFVITNQQVINISGSKTWEDADNQDGVRPESITINLLADGTEIADKIVTAADNWSWSFTDLPKYKTDGIVIAYTITEDEVADYTPQIGGYNVTNTHTPGETGKTVQKVWDDNNDQDGIRPDSVMVQLLADGVAYGAPVELNEANDWAYEWTGLPEKSAGKLITYTVDEISAIEGYTTSYSADTFTITNTHTPEKTVVSGSKTWKDADDQDGLRPANIVINLYANGDYQESRTVTAGDGWSWAFEGLAKYADGEVITYTITENAVEGYSSEVDGYNVTNTHIPETVEVGGSKTWEDADDQDGVRPESITIHLLADGGEKDSRTVTEESGWSWSFTNLPKYKNGGTEIKYTITEDTVDGYTPEVNGYNVTNTHTPGETGRTVQKVWNDCDNQDGIRPERVAVQLLADGAAYGDLVELSEKNGWSYTWSKLPEKSAGKPIEYTVKEIEEITGYTTSYSEDTFTITNTHAPATVDVGGSKTWEDADDQDGARPASITINLLAAGSVIDTKTVTAGDNWTWSFIDLPKYADGKEIAYTIEEEAVIGYTPNVEGYDVTNTHIPETVEVSGSKTWEDADNQDGARPERITINLYANGVLKDSRTVTEKDGWTWSFTDLPKYENGGQEIKYTITEDAVAGYTSEINGYDVTNTHTPGETGRTVQKVWNDHDNQDGIRPASVKVQLFADGAAYKEPVVLSAENGWSYSWTGLPERSAGRVIVYTVEELGSVAGYTTSYSADTFIITNTHTPEKVTFSGSKTWNDADDQDGIRPANIVINLYGNGSYRESRTVTAADGWSWTFENLDKYANGEEIAYTITENAVEGYSSKVDGYNVTNAHTPETVKVEGSKTWDDVDDQDGVRPESITINLYADGILKDSRIVTEKDGWTWSFENLPKYADGVKITYTITENVVEGYSQEVKGYDVTNTHTPGKTGRTVQKVWNDSDDQDGLRPDSVKVQLLADGAAYGEPVVLSAENGWSYTWTGLPEKSAGELVEYTVKELEEIAGYTTSYSADTFIIINTHTPETVKVEGSKTWDDADDQDGARPESITINLFADGVLKDSRIVTEKDGWTWSFTALPKYADGVEITYIITEDAVAGYTSEVNDFDVTNTHMPETVRVEGSKTWDDADNQDGARPESITINLYADGVLKDSRTVTEKDGWTWSFENLPKYADGVKITYTITENVVEGYSQEVKGYDVTNTHTPGKTGRTVQKVWNDSDDQDGLRPDSVKVQLLADGAAYGEPVVLSAENGWSYTWTGLPEKSAGELVEYTVKELEEIAGYTTSYSADTFIIINTHTPETVKVEGSKTWEDADDQDGVRPENITINLYADGVLKDSRTVTEKDGWTWSFDKLPKYADGVKITYTITENAVEGYSQEVKGYDVTNTYTPGKTGRTVQKVWNDSDNQDGLRPVSVTVQLLADGAAYGEPVELSKENGWSYTWSGLPEKKAGKLIKYTVKELEEIAGYTTSYSADTFIITNTHTLETIDIEGSEIWDDVNNQDHIRPDSVTVELWADGVKIGSRTVTAGDDWKWSFPDLPKYDEEGQEITYIVTEAEIEGYTTKKDGNDTIHVHVPKTTPEDPTAPDTPEKGQLVIIVLDEVTKEPVPGATVRITAPDGSVIELVTGRDGRVLGDFEMGQYKVEVIKVPDGYTVTIGRTTTVTVEQSQSVEHIAEIAKNEGQVGEDETGHLPITGMLVWPVSVLSIMGALLTAIGILDNRRRKRL